MYAQSYFLQLSNLYDSDPEGKIFAIYIILTADSSMGAINQSPTFPANICCLNAMHKYICNFLFFSQGNISLFNCYSLCLDMLIRLS